MSALLERVKARVRKSRPAYVAAASIQALLRHGIAGMVRGTRGADEHVKSTISLMSRATVIKGKPMNITIEPTNYCNLECPVCETGARVLGRESKHMTMEQYKTIIDQVAPYTNTLMFYFMGEPFLNKDAYQMIRYSKDLGIPFITTCTNGDLVKPRELVESGIDEVSFQIGGMTQETHKVYRINSRLDKVFPNLQETIRIKKETGSKMRVVSGFILMKHNEHEVPEFKRRMAEMGVDDAVVIDPCVRTVEQGKKMLPTDKEHWFYDPVAFDQGVLRPKTMLPNVCPWIYYSISIHVNGDVVPCCRDPKGEEVMGNLLTQTLDEVWNGAKFQNFRDRLNKEQGKIGICKLCSGYGVSPIKH